MSGCGCGKKKPPAAPPPSSVNSQSFALELNGRSQAFGSNLEARAANVRAGGTGHIRPVLRST
jgi:hypothetical protein